MIFLNFIFQWLTIYINSLYLNHIFTYFTKCSSGCSACDLDKAVSEIHFVLNCNLLYWVCSVVLLRCLWDIYVCVFIVVAKVTADVAGMFTSGDTKFFYLYFYYMQLVDSAVISNIFVQAVCKSNTSFINWYFGTWRSICSIS